MEAKRIAKAEFERLVHRTAGDLYLGRPFAGMRETMTVAERVGCARARARRLRTLQAAGSLAEPWDAKAIASRAVMKLSAAGARAEQLAASVVCPDVMSEQMMRPFVKAFSEQAKMMKLPIADVSIVRAPLEMPFLTAVAVGTPGKESEPCPDGTYAIVQCGLAGAEGTIRMLHKHEQKLLGRYASHFLRKAEALADTLDMREAIAAGFSAGAVYQKSCSEGGIMDGLWELGEDVRCGMQVSLPDIMIDQTTIEVCEVLDRNPYQICGGGCILMVTPEPETLLQALWTRNLPAEKIGTLHTEAVRQLVNKEEIRCLEPYRG